MELKVAKTFDRNGRRYRAGDAPPPELDKTTVQHYLRHGMLVEAPPNAPARQARTAAPRQKQEAKTAAPQSTGGAGPSQTGSAGPAQTGEAGPQEAQPAAPAEGSAPSTAPEAT